MQPPDAGTPRALWSLGPSPEDTGSGWVVLWLALRCQQLVVAARLELFVREGWSGFAAGRIEGTSA